MLSMSSILDFVNLSASYIGPFFVLLGLLIFVHELGHFLVAKYFGVKVEVFSLGFGKKVFQFQKGDTNYCISIVPLGGYVKMYGDDPTADIPEQGRHLSFLHKPVGARIAIVLAGPLMNLFFAAFIFTVVGFLGEKMPAPIIGDVSTKSKAYNWGFRSGMRVDQIEQQPIKTWDEVEEYIKQHPNKELSFKVNVEDGKETLIKARTQLGENDNLLSSDRQVGVIDGLSPVSLAPTVGISNINSPAMQSGMSGIENISKINGKEIQFLRQLQHEMQAIAQQRAGDERVVIQIESSSLLEQNEKTATSRTFEIQLSGNDFTAETNLFEFLGFEKSELFLYQIKKDSPAERSGLKTGDKLQKVNEMDISEWDVIVQEVKNYNGSGEPIQLQVLRNGEIKNVEVVPEMTELIKSSGAEESRFTIGIIPAVISTLAEPILIKYTHPIAALKRGISQSWKWTKMVSMSFVRMLQNEVSAKNIGGVISIGKFAGQSYQVGLSPFLKLMAIISINLFLINLLPVPILDGGHLLFFTIEAIRGAPLSMRKMEIAQQVGLIILMSLMVFALFNDISNILNPPW